MAVFRTMFFCAALSLLFVADMPAQEDTASTVLVLGPKTFGVPTGTPANEIVSFETASFALPLPDQGPFTLLSENRGATVHNVELNGRSLLGPGAFDAPSVHLVVPLERTNTLHVELSGREGASLIIMITGYQHSFHYVYTGEDRPGARSDMPVTTAVESTEARQFSQPIVQSSVDWRTRNAVTPVKNQGQCGSDWAFSATGALEGLVAIKSGRLDNFSEQELVSCTVSLGNEGCNGGLPELAFEFMRDHGLTTTASYPYTARDGICKRATPVPESRISGFIRIPRGDEQALAARVSHQPVSAAVDVSSAFETYRGGVFNGPCGNQVNHAVLIVGYTDQYWIVKNSWGSSWGSHGYIYLTRGKNLCGIANHALAPE